MRQAGRYLPEFRDLRKRTGSFLDLCGNPEASAEATLQPLKRFPLDAAIVFSDILVVLQALGLPVDFVEGSGPVVGRLSGPNAIRGLPRDIDEIPLEPVRRTLAMVRAELPASVAVLGFAGAPWTLAAYAVEGGTSRNFRRVLDLASTDEDAFSFLIGRLAVVVADHLLAQLEAGADAVQIFDSHAGVLDDEGFRRWSVAPVRAVVERVRARCPDARIIGFPRGAGAGYKMFSLETGVSAVSVDQHIAPDKIAENLQKHLPVQGNLDPARLVEGGEIMRNAVQEIVTSLGKGSLIFNLGHGVVPETPPEHVSELVDLVHGISG